MKKMIITIIGLFINLSVMAAAPTGLVTFKKGDAVEANQMNDNFNYLLQRTNLANNVVAVSNNDLTKFINKAANLANKNCNPNNPFFKIDIRLAPNHTYTVQSLTVPTNVAIIGSSDLSSTVKVTGASPIRISNSRSLSNVIIQEDKNQPIQLSLNSNDPLATKTIGFKDCYIYSTSNKAITLCSINNSTK